MTTPTSIRLLYLGRNKKLPQQIDEALRAELTNAQSSRAEARVLHFVCVTSQKQAIEEIRNSPPHGVLIEVDEGRYNRSRFYQMLRSRLPKAIIVAIHKEDPGQDDFSFDGFIQRPFLLEQARIALAKLLNGSTNMYLYVGHLRLDVAMRLVHGPQGTYHLPPKLCKLLQVLMENKGSTVRREDLMQMVWETKFLGDTRTLDVHIRWLREKIEPDPSKPTHLITVRGHGYRLNEVVAG
jgi:DNA-binding response OmpR family regulator